MAIKKKVTRKKKRPDIDLKVRNLNKLCATDKMKKKHYHHQCGGCWIFGSALAMILSYTQNTSILYAILHGVLSWFYVLFRAMQIWGWF